MSAMTDEALTLDDVDEALRFAALASVRVWEFIDARLDERLKIRGQN